MLTTIELVMGVGVHAQCVWPTVAGHWPQGTMLCAGDGCLVHAQCVWLTVAGHWPQEAVLCAGGRSRGC